MSVADRPAAGLYVAAWALCGLGVAGLLVGLSGIMAMAASFALLAGLVAAIGYQVIARSTRPEGQYRGPSPVLLFVFVYVLLRAVSQIVIAVWGSPATSTTTLFFAATVLTLAGYLVAVGSFVIRTGALTWREMIRAERLDASRAAFDIVIGGATMFGVAIAASVLGGILARLLGTTPPSVLPPMQTSADFVIVALGAGVLIPIGEEVFFRGYTMTAWLRDLGPRSALIRATAFFALVHVLNITTETFGEGLAQAILQIAVIAPVGLALGWLYLKRGLIAAIAGHAAFNLLGVLILVMAQNLPPGTGA